MYKLITCDLDETLLADDKSVPQRNRAAIAAARAQGVHFVPATGRGYTSLEHTLAELGLKDAANEYTISFNGGVITENQGHRIVAETPMDFDLVEQLFQIGIQLNVCIHVYSHQEVYTYNLNPDERAYIPVTVSFTELTTPSIEHLKDTSLMKILFQNLDQQYLQMIHQGLPASLKEKIDISYSSNRYLEFNPAGVNKGAALLQLAGLLGIKQEETLAIGDNLNDLTMIQAAGMGTAVANAAAAVKEKADYVAEKNYNDSGVAEIVEKFVLR